MKRWIFFLFLVGVATFPRPAFAEGFTITWKNCRGYAVYLDPKSSKLFKEISVNPWAPILCLKEGEELKCTEKDSDQSFVAKTQPKQIDIRSVPDSSGNTELITVDLSVRGAVLHLQQNYGEFIHMRTCSGEVLLSLKGKGF